MKSKNVINVSDTDNSAQIQQKILKRVVGRPFAKGVSGNPKGKPKGTRNFHTDFKFAIKEISNPKTSKPYSEIDMVKMMV